MSSRSVFQSRRSVLRLSSSLAITMVGTPALARLTTPVRVKERDMQMSHLHTSEHIGLIFAVDGQYIDPALSKLNHFLRDHYSQEVGVMDPLLYDLLHQIRVDLGVRGSYEVISGYRSPQTNEKLRATRAGGVAQRSLHMDGKAIDVRLPGVPLSDLRDAAKAQNAGGVGFYPSDQFVHIDTGRVRYW